MPNDYTWYVLSFAALSPVFWFLGATLNLISNRFMHRQVVSEGTTTVQGAGESTVAAAYEVRSHSAISAIAAVLGTISYFFAVVGGLFVAVGVGLAALALVFIGGALLLAIMVPIMCLSFIMSLIIEPLLARSERPETSERTA